MKTRRLADLYVRGVEVAIDDGQFDVDEQGNKVKLPPVVVWLQKLNPAEHEQALRSAGAHRAAYLALRHQPDTDEYKSVQDQVSRMERSEMISFVMNEELVKQLLSAEARISVEEEWEKDGYLQGLRDVWPKMQVVLETNPDDKQARQVRDELQRFNQQVDEALEEPRSSLEEKYEGYVEDELVALATERMISINADFEWTREFRKSQIWLATKDVDDRNKHYFETREEVDSLYLPVMKRLQDEYNAISVEPVEGKDSQETPISSPSVEPSKTEGTGVSSGPLVAVQ